MILRDLNKEMIGKPVRVSYTNIQGTLDSYDVNYEDEVKITVDGNDYYLPAEYPIHEYDLKTDYDPAVLFGVVNPWSPYD